MNKVNVSENTKPKKLSKITFGLMSGKDMAACAEFETSSNELYKMPARTPAPNGVLDLRLGVSDKKTACATCGEKLAECIGHFGHIKMHIPVYHIGFFKHTIQILQAICKRCSRVLLTPEERDVALRRMTTAEGALRRLQHLKKVLDRAKKVRCTHTRVLHQVITCLILPIFTTYIHPLYTYIHHMYTICTPNAPVYAPYIHL